VSVPLVAALALEVGLDVHHLVDDGLGSTLASSPTFTTPSSNWGSPGVAPSYPLPMIAIAVVASPSLNTSLFEILGRWPFPLGRKA
jgi:hypothetical protein